MSVKAGEHPKNSQLFGFINEPDYIDTYVCSHLSGGHLDMTLRDVFAYSPFWLKLLIRTRRLIFSSIASSVDNSALSFAYGIEKRRYLKGERFGMFLVYYQSDREFIVGSKGIEIDVFISLYIDSKQNLNVSTAVKTKSFYARVYLAVISPFHKIIVKRSLKEFMKNYEVE